MRMWLKRKLCSLIGHNWGEPSFLWAGRRLVGELWACERCGACVDTAEPMHIVKDATGLGRTQ